ncbi:MAG: hypothetical protein ACYTG6_12075 [Planctomycetota bacterium]
MPRTTHPTLPRALFWALALLAAFAVAGFVPGAAAEDEEEQDDISAQVKAQMEKIIRLMQENEGALLKLSTGEAARPVAPEVPVPPGQEGSSDAGSEGPPPRTGEEISRRLEEMIRGQRSTAGQIPGELEELVRMIPT